MTNNPTIDGVSREKLEHFIKLLSAGGLWQVKAVEAELRALLDAPVVERQPDASVNWQVVATEQMSIIEQRQSTIAQLQAENARIKARLCACRDCGGQGEVYSGHDSYQGHFQPPEPDMDTCGTCCGDGVLGPLEDFEALASERDQLQARVAELESGRGKPVGEVGSMPGTSGFTMAAFKADEVPIGTKLFTAPPAPVAVALPERLREIHEFLNGSGTLDGYSFGSLHPSGRKYWWRNELRACLDATAALNTPK